MSKEILEQAHKEVTDAIVILRNADEDTGVRFEKYIDAVHYLSRAQALLDVELGKLKELGNKKDVYEQSK